MPRLIDDELANAQLIRAMSPTPYGGADIGECLAVADRVQKVEPSTWHDAWRALADRLMSIGDRCTLAGDQHGARSAFLRASNYYRVSGTYLFGKPVDPLLRSAHEAEVDAFTRGAALFDVPPLEIKVPIDGTDMTCYFFRPSPVTAARRTIILTTGYDGSAQELYFSSGAAALGRGYNVVTYDGPGQGAMLLDHEVPMRPDWEAVVTPIVDALVMRHDVDPTRIALMGLSLGGYLAPRAASQEHRLAACISDCGPYDVGASAASRLPGILASGVDAQGGVRRVVLERAIQAVMSKPSAGWALRRAMLVHDLADPLDYFTVARDYTLKGIEAEIVCPTLVCNTDIDDLSASAPEFYAALTCPKKLVTFKAADGAGEHCESGARVEFNRVAFNWLDTVLRP